MNGPRLILRAAVAGALAGAAGASAQPQATSNFHSVGIDVDPNDEEAFTRSILGLTKDCALIELDEDDLVCRRETDKGGQIWIGLRKKGGAHEVVTANPGFVGKSKFPVRIQGVQSDPEWEPFEYRLEVTFSDYDIPLLIELADPREASRFRDLDTPQELTLDVTAFTFNPEIFADEEAFRDAQQELGDNVSYATDFFIPSGLFGENTSSRATFGGEIIDAERVNTNAGASHWRALVKVQGGGTVNVVFDDIWSELEPKPGHLISGAFWLSAQIPAAE
ncbi:MAG: hypothetical protein QNI87_10505 [Erythrobacter sp.]|uniref:hypothetical protein n=1 Tax=Erythrobacter sp. TaxID=1042 RepID=UPI002617FC04|nr:hypothetical protein [Erythrobacter sp.]MDJ0978956.1 hypothetical protein [Erythrobacter sp.]